MLCVTTMLICFGAAAYVFLFFWWIFFTDGHIPRYLWYGRAIAALFAGLPLWEGLRALIERKSFTRAIGLGALSGLILASAIRGSGWELQRVLHLDTMADDHALAAYVRELPPATTLATTVWPLGKELTFLTGRYVKVIREAEPYLSKFDSFIVMMKQADSTPLKQLRRYDIGPYAILATEGAERHE